MRTLSMPADIPGAWVPDWARRAVFYHIHPYGFLGAPLVKPAGGPVPRLAALRAWIPHLAEMGVSALYLGPVSCSMRHGYDTVDLRRVDERLGDAALLKDLVESLHAAGIRVILDGVYNHVGRDFHAFQDVRRRGRASPYAGWFHIDWTGDNSFGDGFAYESWAGLGRLPRLNLSDPAARAHVIDSGVWWLTEIGADGWRLDAAHEIAPAFWRDFRRACKAARPDCLLVGELVHGDYGLWTGPDLLDAATDYQLYDALWSAVAGGHLSGLAAELRRAHAPGGLYAGHRLLSFLGNHDVDRLMTRLGEVRKLRQALGLLFALPGIPCLYYGDEIGLAGRHSPDNWQVRQPMPPRTLWPAWAEAAVAWTGRLAALRRRLPALADGGCRVVVDDGTDLAVLRPHPAGDVLVAASADPDRAAVAVPCEAVGEADFADALDPDAAPLARRGAHLLVPLARDAGVGIAAARRG